MLVPPVLARGSALPARWRMRLALLAVLGMGAGSMALMAAALFPEILAASSLGELWEYCSRFVHRVARGSIGALPSFAAGFVFLFVLGRFIVALVQGMRATRRARVRGGEVRWRLAGGHPVFVVPLGHPCAYSVAGQVVVSEGLLDALNGEERRAVLAHEEAHIRGRHHMGLLLARSVAAAVAPIPQVSVGLVVLERAMEEAADDYAARRLGDGRVVASSLAKAALAGLRRPAAGLALGEGPDVPARIRRLLTPSPVARGVSGACAMAVGLLGTLLAVTPLLGSLAALAAAHHVAGLGSSAFCPVPAINGALGAAPAWSVWWGSLRNARMSG